MPVEVERVHLEPNTNVASIASTKDTVVDNNREIGKWLNAMEIHSVQKFRKRGKPCDCGQFRHIPGIEGLCEETIAMVDNPDIYYRIITLGKELEPKVTLEAIASGKYDNEFPQYAVKYRNLRKELLGSLKPEAMFPDIISPRIAPKAKQELEIPPELAKEPVGAKTEDSEVEEARAPKIWPNGTVCEHLLPMVEWVQGGDAEKCRDCMFTITIPWYYEELQERGLNEIMEDMEKIQKEGDPIKVAAALDQIKEQVEPEVKQRLLEFDCATQSFETDELPSE